VATAITTIASSTYSPALFHRLFTLSLLLNMLLLNRVIIKLSWLLLTYVNASLISRATFWPSFFTVFRKIAQKSPKRLK
jgi:hypothetical protein